MNTIPFKDAALLLHMNGEKDSISNNRMTVKGDVKLGVKLKGSDLAASLERGGDGEAAEFSGGYIAFEKANDLLDFSGGSFTIAIRLCVPDGNWKFPILGSFGSNQQVSCYIHAVDGHTLPMKDRQFLGDEIPSIYAWMFGNHNGPRIIKGNPGWIEVIWGAEKPNAKSLREVENISKKVNRDDFPLYQDTRDAVMRIGFPVQFIDPCGWHDIIVRFIGSKLQLFIDGVLVDEEYPIGDTRRSLAPFLIGGVVDGGTEEGGFQGLIDHVAVWRRALSESEIVMLSGGTDVAERREIEILGSKSTSMQYYRPRGHNSKAGDCIPFWHDGTFHLFYLILRRNMHSKWDGGHGGLEIHHASTRDLITWEHHPVVAPITEQWESWNGTGGVVFNDNKFYWFYPTPSSNPEWQYGGIQLSTSSDCIIWEKQEPHPFLTGADCDVFKDERTGLFNLIKRDVENYGGPLPDQYKDLAKAKSCSFSTIARFVSRDLIQWEKEAEPFIITESDKRAGMCPHFFKWNDWYYFFGGNSIWRSRSQYGPWAMHRPERLDPGLFVPKTAAFGINRRILAGFIFDGGWGGDLVLRELIQFPDGHLGTRFIKEMMPKAEKSLQFMVESEEGVTVTDKVTVAADNDKSKRAILSGIPHEARITMEVVPEEGDFVAFNIAVRGRKGVDEGCQVQFNSHTQTVSFQSSTDGGGRLCTWNPITLLDVDGLERTFSLDIVCIRDIIDIEINKQRTVCNRFWAPDSDCVALTAESGTVTFRNIRISIE